MPTIAVIGTTSWGTTLSIVLAKNGTNVRLWARTEEEAAEFPPGGTYEGVSIPKKVHVTTSVREALSKADAVILAVPSQRMRHNMQIISSHITKSILLINAAKGIEIETGKLMTQVIAEEISPDYVHNICVLSGPNLSREVLNGLPAAAVIAAEDEKIAKHAQKLLSVQNFCVFTNSDVLGVELGGALKNIIALGAGIIDGLGYGDNAKAALITRGLTEITALGVALGANPLTFSGLAGIGDLMATCASPLSRNHYVGVELAQGRKLDDIQANMTGIAEGVTTTLAVWKIAKEMGLEMPITETVHKVLYEGADIKKMARELMNLSAAHELAGRKWRLFSAFRRRKRANSQVSSTISA